MQTVSRKKCPFWKPWPFSVLPDFLVSRHSLRCCKLLNYLIIADSHRGGRRFESFSSHPRWLLDAGSNPCVSAPGGCVYRKIATPLVV